MFFLMVFDIAFICLSYGMFKNYKDIKMMMNLFIVGFSIYSGIGIVLYDIDNEVLYFIQFILFSIMFIGVSYLKKDKTTSVLNGMDFVNEHHMLFIYIMSAIYLLTFIYPLILGRMTFKDLLNIASVFTDYTATPFSVRVARRSNIFYTILTNQVRSICMPFFYLLLYQFRKKPSNFIIMFLLPVLLKTVADGYLSRNNMVVYIAFIFVYLVMEGYLNKRIAIVIAAVSVPIGLSVLNLLASVRTGGSFEFSISTIGENISALADSECSYPKYYNVCASMFDLRKTFNFFIYILLVIVPSQFYSFIGLSVPNLAYSFTEAVLGMSYGARDYYIVLPSVLGEATILFGKFFAWIYGGIYALFVMWFLRVLSRNRSLKYLKLYFMLDFFRQFRGGSQYVVSTWLTTIIPFIFLVYFLSKRKITFGGKELFYNASNDVEERAE